MRNLLTTSYKYGKPCRYIKVATTNDKKTFFVFLCLKDKFTLNKASLKNGIFLVTNEIYIEFSREYESPFSEFL